MAYDTPVGATLYDHPGGLVGRPLDRVDGRLKVTGRAPYAAEYAGQDKTLYGFVLTSSIAKGRLLSLDAAAAEAMPGIRLVLSWRNAPPQSSKEDSTGDGKPSPVLESDRISHVGQPIALVVADTFEAARAAAKRLRPTYAREPAAAEMKPRLAQATTPHAKKEPDTAVGDFDTAFASAPVKLDVAYTTPHQSHAMMEPHASMAHWEGDRVVIHTANQMISPGAETIAATLNIPKDKVRLVSRYVGGGFGGKLAVWPDATLAAIASRMLGGRAVKVVLTRPQVFETTGHRPETLQRLRLGADAQGRLSAIAHDVWCDNNVNDDFYETAAEVTRTLYAGANRRTTHRLVKLDTPIGCSMRAPGEAVGLLALECAMDELAEKVGVDPIELRVRNEPTEDPEKHIPYSSRHLVACMREGADRFGWSRRVARPAQVRDGRWLVGMGMATASRGVLLTPAKCHVALDARGVVTARLAMTDIGTGTYTILTQIAAEALGLPIDKVVVEMGDTDFPETKGSGGSWGANSAGSAVDAACAALRERLASLAGVDISSARFEGGRLLGPGAGQTWTLASFAAATPVEAMGEFEGGALSKQYSQQSYGAHFAEVGVDLDTAEIRLRRMVSVFTAGRILNEKTARSQCLGGMTMGLGAALTEELVLDPRFAAFVNHDLAEYHVPTNADIPSLEVIFLPELDDKASPLKSKGIGELGICGVGASVANAVYNATGVRIRDYPLTLDKVLAGLTPA